MNKKFMKFVAKQIKELGNRKDIITGEGCTRRLTVKIKSVIPPTTEWGDFRVNVEVIRSERETYVYGEDGRYMRGPNGLLLREYKDMLVPRSAVNSVNGNIRREVNHSLGYHLEIFGFRRYQIKVEKVKHLV